MPGKKSLTKYTVVKPRVIYVILSPFDNRFYVSVTVENALRNRYKEHNTQRQKRTNDLFEEALIKNQRPQMYLLEKLECTETEAYSHCVAWIRLFQEHGLLSLSNDTTNYYAQNLTSETRKLYEEFSKIPYEKIICEERNLFPKYGTRGTSKKERSENDLIGLIFYTTEEEAELIKERAQKKGKSQSAYCRDIILDYSEITVDYSFLTDYLAELRGAKDLLRQTIYTIYQTKEYNPSDLKNIQNMVNIISSHTDSIRTDLEKSMDEISKKFRAAKRRKK